MRNFHIATDGLTAFAAIALVLAALTGWVWNVVKIFSTIGDPITGVFIGRVIGVFVFPIGCIVGWM